MEGCQGRKLAIVAGGVGCHKTRRLWSSCHPLCTTLPCNEFFLHRRIFCILHPKKKRKWDCRIFRPFALAWRHNKLLTIWDKLRATLDVIKRHEKRRRWWSSLRSLQQGGHQRGGGGHQVSHRWPSKGWTPDRGTHQADGTAWAIWWGSWVVDLKKPLFIMFISLFLWIHVYQPLFCSSECGLSEPYEAVWISGSDLHTPNALLLLLAIYANFLALTH